MSAKLKTIFADCRLAARPTRHLLTKSGASCQNRTDAFSLRKNYATIITKEAYTIIKTFCAQRAFFTTNVIFHPP